MADLMPPNPVPIHEPFLWWVGLETLLRHQKHDNIANQIFNQLRRLAMNVSDELIGALYVITLGERTWRYIVAEFKRTNLPAYKAAGVTLERAIEYELHVIK